MEFHHPGNTGQIGIGCLHACVKLLNKAIHVEIKLFLQEEKWLQQQKRYSWNEEMVEYLLNSLNIYKANMG